MSSLLSIITALAPFIVEIVKIIATSPKEAGKRVKAKKKDKQIIK
jgi:hypothetical protein